jgi:hypothetical protein
VLEAAATATATTAASATATATAAATAAATSTTAATAAAPATASTPATESAGYALELLFRKFFISGSCRKDQVTRGFGFFDDLEFDTFRGGQTAFRENSARITQKTLFEFRVIPCISADQFPFQIKIAQLFRLRHNQTLRLGIQRSRTT